MATKESNINAARGAARSIASDANYLSRDIGGDVAATDAERIETIDRNARRIIKILDELQDDLYAVLQGPI